MSDYDDWLLVYTDLSSRLATATGATVYQINPFDKFQLTSKDGAYIRLVAYLDDDLPIGGTFRRRCKVQAGLVVKVSDPETREAELAKAKCSMFGFKKNVVNTTPATYTVHNRIPMGEREMQDYVVSFCEMDIRF